MSEMLDQGRMYIRDFTTVTSVVNERYPLPAYPPEVRQNVTVAGLAVLYETRAVMRQAMRQAEIL